MPSGLKFLFPTRRSVDPRDTCPRTALHDNFLKELMLVVVLYFGEGITKFAKQFAAMAGPLAVNRRKCHVGRDFCCALTSCLGSSLPRY
jgi:hypothetical protein